MSESMVDVVARAIQNADGMPLNMARCHARAAIEAMRHFTSDMEQLGIAAMKDGGSFERVWNAAINGAMK